jgi:hypothetical protein
MDFATIMQANLDLAFGDATPHSASRRSETSAMKTRSFHDPERSARGHEAISQAVTDVSD